MTNGITSEAPLGIFDSGRLLSEYKGNAVVRAAKFASAKNEIYEGIRDDTLRLLGERCDIVKSEPDKVPWLGRYVADGAVALRFYTGEVIERVGRPVFNVPMHLQDASYLVRRLTEEFEPWQIAARRMEFPLRMAGARGNDGPVKRMFFVVYVQMGADSRKVLAPFERTLEDVVDFLELPLVTNVVDTGGRADKATA